MVKPPTEQVTQMLVDWSNGDQAALEKLAPLVYDELRRLAHRYMRRERLDHTLQTTALVNEAYLRFIDQKSVNWKNRAQFFAICASLMRRILVDYARSRLYAKRAGQAHEVTLEEAAIMPPKPATSVIAVDEALESLAAIDPRKSRIVELRFFGGLTIEETAEVLEASPATIKREWNAARVMLFREIKKVTTGNE